MTQYEQMHIIPYPPSLNQYFRINGMNSIAIIITMEVHYTACEGNWTVFQIQCFSDLLNSPFFVPLFTPKGSIKDKY